VKLLAILPHTPTLSRSHIRPSTASFQSSILCPGNHISALCFAPSAHSNWTPQTLEVSVHASSLRQSRRIRADIIIRTRSHPSIDLMLVRASRTISLTVSAWNTDCLSHIVTSFSLRHEPHAACTCECTASMMASCMCVSVRSVIQWQY
jgi:hypothetical protein